MGAKLVVVESPAKSKTLEKYLGKDFKVLASYGHVRDLRPKEGAVDPEHGFAMHYEIIERNQKHVDAIARALKKADALYLATDPDREGEAISWHLHEILKERGLLEDSARVEQVRPGVDDVEPADRATEVDEAVVSRAHLEDLHEGGPIHARLPDEVVLVDARAPARWQPQPSAACAFAACALAFSQSARNRARPMSVSGCFIICLMTPNGTVHTSAPIIAHWSRWLT